MAFSNGQNLMLAVAVKGGPFNGRRIGAALIVHNLFAVMDDAETATYWDGVSGQLPV